MYDSKGKIILRPKKQDVKPKAFKFPATFMIINFELTDRYILWMIWHYPYIFNFHFHEDIAKISPKQLNNDSNFGKSLKILQDLKMKKLVRQSKDGDKLYVSS